MSDTIKTNGKAYPRFMSMGTGYDTLVAVTARLAILTTLDTVHGPSDGRTTERAALLEDLSTFARDYGADDPHAAIISALGVVQYVAGHPGTPVLSLLEELEIAIHHTNQEKPND